MTTRAVVVLVALGLFACNDKKPARGDDKPPSGGSPEAPDPEVKPSKLPAGFVKPAAPPKAKDALYIATEKALLSVEGGRFVKVADLPKYFGAADLTLDHDGGLWALGRESVARLEGAQWKTIKLSDGNGALKRLAVHGPDNIDVIGVYGISHFDGTGWTLAKTDDLIGPKTGGLQDLVVDGSGVGYAAAYNHLLIRKNKLWESLPKDDNLYGALDIGADGTLVIGTSNSVLEVEGDGFRRIGIDCIGSDRVALRGDKIFVACHDKLLTIERKSTATSALALGSGGLDVDMVRAVAADEKGRVYIGASAGFFVVLPDGTHKSFKLGSVPLMASGPRAILASGNGPDPLPGEEAIRFGAVKGKLFKKGKPLANVPVELCTNTSSFIKPGQTPCSEASWKTGGTTAADGGFAFAKVPIGNLEFAYRPAGSDKWTLVIGFDCCAELQEGKLLDVGPIDMM